MVRRRLRQLWRVERALATLVEQRQCNVEGYCVVGSLPHSKVSNSHDEPLQPTAVAKIGRDAAKNLARPWNEVLVSARSVIVEATHSSPRADQCRGMLPGGFESRWTWI